MEQENRPKVGVGIMIIKNGKVLLGKRKGSHGAGQYAWPGVTLSIWSLSKIVQSVRFEKKREWK